MQRPSRYSKLVRVEGRLVRQETANVPSTPRNLRTPRGPQDRVRPQPNQTPTSHARPRVVPRRLNPQRTPSKPQNQPYKVGFPPTPSVQNQPCYSTADYVTIPPVEPLVFVQQPINYSVPVTVQAPASPQQCTHIPTQQSPYIQPRQGPQTPLKQGPQIPQQQCPHIQPQQGPQIPPQQGPQIPLKQGPQSPQQECPHIQPQQGPRAQRPIVPSYRVSSRTIITEHITIQGQQQPTSTQEELQNKGTEAPKEQKPQPTSDPEMDARMLAFLIYCDEGRKTADEIFKEVIDTKNRNPTKIQLRGSKPPPWFPGYYHSLTSTGDVEVAACPQDIMQRAWEAKM